MWPCPECHSLNRASSSKCYRCRVPRASEPAAPRPGVGTVARVVGTLPPSPLAAASNPPPPVQAPAAAPPVAERRLPRGGYCITCGASFLSGARFCASCGQAVSSEAAAVGGPEGFSPSLRSPARPGTPLPSRKIIVAAATVVVFVVAAALIGSRLLANPAQSPGDRSRTPMVSPVPVVADTGAQLCEAYAVVLSASQETAQVAQAYLDNAANVTGSGVANVQAAAKAHAPNVERAVLSVVPALDTATFPSDPDFLAGLRQAASGLVQAARAWQAWADAGTTSYSGDFITALDAMTSSKDGYNQATTELNRLDAAGTLKCP
jgi:hypothetical protein